MNDDTDLDLSVTHAVDRLRAADPAHGARRLRLTAGDVLDRDGASSEKPPRVGRHAGWGLAAAAIVIALFGIVAIQVFANGSGRPVIATPSGRNQPDAAGCDTTAKPGTKLSQGAVAVRLCDAPERKDFPSGIAPPDVLRQHVGVLVDVYNGLKKLPRNASCRSDLGYRYQLVFSYPNGTAVHVYGELYGCERIGDRTGSVAMVDKFDNLLRQQRQHVNASQPRGTDQPPGTELGCPFQQGSYYVPKPSELVAGVLCAGGNETFVPNRLVHIDHKSWRLLKADLVRHSSPGEPDGRCSEPPNITLVAVDGYGDPLAVDIMCDVGWWQPSPGAHTQMRWQPSAEALAILNKQTGR